MERAETPPRGSATWARPTERGRRFRPTGIWLLAWILVPLAACGDRDREAGEAAHLPPFPPPVPEPARTVTAAHFAGSDACRACHEGPWRAWAGSTHGRAGGPATPELVLAPFDGTPIRFADATVLPRRTGEAYSFVVRQAGHEELVWSVDAVVGGAHMVGGGSQGYLTRWADGTVRFLPFDWSGAEAAWFCNTGGRLDRGWLPIVETMRLADCGDWPPVRVLGTVERYANCQECHGSRIEASLDPGRGYDTRWATLQVDCESCHGPAGAHVAAAEAGQRDPAAALSPPSLATLDKDASLALCFRCHALKDVLREGWVPGETLESHYALKFPSLGDDPYLPDGRVRTFAYQEGHLASACYLDGPMDCVSCHEPHGQGYRDPWGRALDGPLDDGQCLSCHPSKARDPAAHTFHPEGSEGSRCVSCHMPYLQHPEVGPDVGFARSDHTIPVPRPTLDGRLGIAGACATCHEDSSAAELQAWAEDRWGTLRPPRQTVSGPLALADEADGPAAAAALLHPGAGDPLLQFRGLARYFEEWLQPDRPPPDGAREALAALAADPDLDVRALALAALHWSAGNDPDVRALLVRALAGDEGGALRARWRLALGYLGDRAREEARLERGATAYRKALELGEDARVLAARGLLLNRAGDPAAAATALRRSAELDGDRPLTWVNLGVALAAQGDQAGAVLAYERALGLDPHEPLALFNLGNLRLRAGDVARAAEAYAMAVAANPGLADAQFNLARTLIRLNRIREALPHARRAVEFDPDHAGARQMLADLETALGADPGGR